MDNEKSKSQIKREAKALQALGEEIASLSNTQLKKIPLPEHIFDAVMMLKSIKSYAARKRQIQLLGRYLREYDDIHLVQDAYEALISSSVTQSKQLEDVELWRARLMSDDKQALTDFLDQYPCDDVQKLRILVRHAVIERDQQKKPGSAKLLFRFIRVLMS